VASAAAAVLFQWRSRLRSNSGQIAIATTTAQAKAGRKSQMIQVPIAKRAEMSANWPSRRDEGEPRAFPPDGDLDWDGSGIMAANALFNPSNPTGLGSIAIFRSAEHVKIGIPSS
jgi:hypothetical protein